MGMGMYGMMSPFPVRLSSVRVMGAYGANPYMMGPEDIHKMQDLDDSFKHIPPSMWPGATNPINHMGMYGGGPAPYNPPRSSGSSTSGMNGGSSSGGTSGTDRGNNGRSSSSTGNNGQRPVGG